MAASIDWIETEAGDDVVVTGRVLAETKNGRKLDAPYAHVFSFVRARCGTPVRDGAASAR